MHATNGNQASREGEGIPLPLTLKIDKVGAPLNCYLINTNGLGIVRHTDSQGSVIGKRFHNKAQSLAETLWSNKADLALVTETHSTTDQRELIHLDQVNSSPQQGKSGGTAIFGNKGIPLMPESQGTNVSVGSTMWGSNTIFVVCVYVPPNRQGALAALSNLDSTLDSLRGSNVIVGGDFNITETMGGFLFW